MPTDPRRVEVVCEVEVRERLGGLGLATNVIDGVVRFPTWHEATLRRIGVRYRDKQFWLTGEDE